MTLENAKRVLDGKIAENILDTYALLVYKGGERAFISTPGTDEDTLFDIASMGKVLVTSTLILKAISEGTLKLDDTLPVFFRDVPDDKKPVTVKHLLTHTSGIVRRGMPDSATCRGNVGITDFIMQEPLAFPIGSRYEYSCYGYILLGYILEKVYDKRLDELWYTTLKPALGMTRSRFDPALDTPNMALTHYRADIGYCASADDIAYRMRGVAGNGASFFTANDIERFVKAVLRKDPQLYNEELFALAETDHTPSFTEGRGLGYLVTDRVRYAQTGTLFPDGSFGHCGNTGTSFYMNRDEELYVILLTNATRFSYIKHDFKGCDYSVTMKMREDVHNAIHVDLGKSNR